MLMVEILAVYNVYTTSRTDTIDWPLRARDSEREHDLVRKLLSRVAQTTLR